MATGHQIALARHRTPLAHSQKPSRSQVPAFLQKLYEMLNDPNNFHLIRWSEAGDSFIVPNHEQFAREVLGRWFKHQNFHSFVRQLNMYGFHKIPQLQQGVLKSDSDIEIWNFAHPHFRRGEPHLLGFIQRKRQAAQNAQGDGIVEGVAAGAGAVGTIDFHDAANNSTTTGTSTSGQLLDIHSIVNGISAIKRHQSSIQAELAEIKQSNQLLWQDAMDVRAKYQKQQDTINRILKFLAGVFGNRASPHKDDEVEALNSRVVIPPRRSRLMIEDIQSKKAGLTEVHDENEDQTTEARFLGHDDYYPSIETPLTAPSPASSDHTSPLITETTTHFSSDNPPSQLQPQPSLQHQQPPPSMYPLHHDTQATQPSQPRSQTQPPQHPDHALTPSRSPNPPQGFDIQQALSQLTPQQISQLFSLTFSPFDSSIPDTHTVPPTNPSSQLTSYQPSLFDFSHLTQAPRDDHEQDHEQDLISFDPSLDKQWKVTDDLDKEVNMLDTSIHSFMQDMQDMGLDPRQLDASAGAPLPPMLDSTQQQQQQQPLLHPLATQQLPPHLSHSHSQPSSTPTSTDHSSSLLQVPSMPMPVSDSLTTNDDFDDMYSFLNLGRDVGPEEDDSMGASADADVGAGAGAGVDAMDPSTAFLDDVQPQQVPPEPDTDRRVVSISAVSSKKTGNRGKRKSDVALGKVEMEVPSPPAPEPALSAPKRGGVKMNMNVTGTARPAKRRKNK